MVFVAAAARPSRCHPLWLLGFVVLLPGTCSQCGSLPRLSHAIPSDPNRTEGFPINTEVTYRCLNGFVKIPGKSDTVVCLSNSQWSNIEEFCGRSCLAPPRLKSAELSPEDLRKNYYPVGTTVSYVCRLAYESTGLRPVITCLENLTWAEAPEFCLGKSCGVPESPEHGRLVDATNNRFGAKVNIICDDGYKVSGRHFIQCLLNRDQVEWSKLPTCQLITCSPPPNITNGMHNGNHLESFDYNSSVTYKCDPNFSLTGEASIHCTTKDNINGVWNGSAPECKAITCSPPPNITNGMHNGSHLESFDYNASVTYKCDPNFSLTGEASIHCTTKDNINGVWNGSAPECKAITCSPPPNITNGMHNGNHLESFDYNTSVTYKCDPNFSLTGEASIHCTTKDNINGVWNGSAPECKAITCSPPPNITNGMHNGNHLESFDYNSSVTYKCDPNFSLTGEASIHCTTKDNINGVWNGSAPECKAITCSPPPNITNGMHNGNHLESFDYNTSVTYKCDPNFSLTGEASIHCTTKDNINGVWNGSAPECKVIITQDKPTTVPPEGAEVAGTSSGLGVRIDIGIGSGVGIVVLVAVAAIIPLAILKNNRMKDLCQKEIPLQLRCERCSGITNSHNFSLDPASWYSVNKHCEEQPMRPSNTGSTEKEMMKGREHKTEEGSLCG
ncbi:unnamed protein product [Eretmochelys imbricata]